MFDALVCGKSYHPAARNIVTENNRLRYHRVKPGISTSPGLGSVPGRNRQMNGETDGRA